MRIYWTMVSRMAGAGRRDEHAAEAESSVRTGCWRTTDPGASAEFPKELFGDWGGRRSELDDHGVDFELGYINDVCG